MVEVSKNMSNNMPDNNFRFNISLSVLNHLGRNLYRSFATVLGEAISNSWDADAQNVRIYLDRDKNTLCIRDDGDGMTTDDFQEKFLKIGYSKRTLDGDKSAGGRPYIGRKGIGKLALLSCAKKISVKSKVEGGEYIGGMIDNAGLDQAIKDDVSSHDYELDRYDDSSFKQFENGHTKGTIIYFENIKDGIHNADDFLKKIIALYFRFSLVDSDFNIYLNDELVTLESLKQLADKTQFVWNVNNFKDPYLSDFCTNVKETVPVTMNDKVKGFIASVEKPQHRNIHSTGERVAVDLFVNGRLRETDILKHLSSLKARVPESYLYGQIHFDSLDAGSDDPFTSSREGVKSESEEYKNFLEELKKVVLAIIDQWDGLREKYEEDGDPDNPRKTTKQRKAEELASAVFKEFLPSEDSEQHGKVERWGKELRQDASFNFESYADCFASENLLRKYIQEKGLKLSPDAEEQVKKWKEMEEKRKGKGNVSIGIRKDANDLNYLTMNDLAYLVDKRDPIKEACLARDANEYEPIRDGIAHTALLTDEAKRKLTSVYENIKARVKNLLSGTN